MAEYEVKIRPERPEETALAAWFQEQEQATLGHIEAGARQIIQLVTVFYGVIFGIISLGKEQIAVSLRSPLVIILSGAAIFSLLLALIFALVVVTPLPIRYRPASLSDQKAAYQAMLTRKAAGLRVATITFGLGLAAFAWLIFDLLYRR